MLIAATVVVLYECGVLLPGALSPHAQSVFVATMVMQLFTIGAIPLSLYMFRIPFINDQLTKDSSMAPRKLLFWGGIRLLLICVPIVANVVLYYLTSMTASFFYLAIILAVSLAFIYPSEKRCKYETTREGSR